MTDVSAVNLHLALSTLRDNCEGWATNEALDLVIAELNKMDELRDELAAARVAWNHWLDLATKLSKRLADEQLDHERATVTRDQARVGARVTVPGLGQPRPGGTIVAVQGDWVAVAWDEGYHISDLLLAAPSLPTPSPEEPSPAARGTQPEEG